MSMRDDAVSLRDMLNHAREAANVNGEGYAGYPTFRDGCTAVEIMDVARAGSDWTAL